MHPEILSDDQKAIVPFIKSFAKEFYLVGGTAIALQIGHRQSIDFDLFRYKGFRKTKIVERLNAFKLKYHLLYSSDDSFHIIVNDVKITFFQYPFKVPAKLQFEGIPMPDLSNLAAMKAYAMGRRSKWKDYVDLYFLLKYHFDIQTINEKASPIFDDLFSPKLFRQQLCYFKDIDYTEEVSFLTGFEVPETEIKAFLTEIAINEI
jgi:Nucleotidyl transferase AbiEii toxin, Type IV TA system